jgi:hypothetical protein
MVNETGLAENIIFIKNPNEENSSENSGSITSIYILGRQKIGVFKLKYLNKENFSQYAIINNRFKFNFAGFRVQTG